MIFNCSKRIFYISNDFIWNRNQWIVLYEKEIRKRITIMNQSILTEYERMNTNWTDLIVW